jgi:nitroreductase
MPLPRLDDAQITVIKDVAGYIQSQRRSYRCRAVPLDQNEKGRHAAVWSSKQFKRNVTVIRMRDILNIIQKRQSARGPFDPSRPIAKQDLEQILEAARWAPTAHNMQNFEIIVVDDRKQLEAIGKIRSEVSETFLRENFLQMSFSLDELRQKKVGVLASMFPPSWRQPHTKPGAAADAMSHAFLGSVLQESPLLLIVIYDSTKRAPASEGDVLGMMSLGCVMENMWLTAESLGIGFHILSVFSGTAVEEEIRKILRFPRHLRIAYACRLGYPSAGPDAYVRVRRDLEQFTHHNFYGNRVLPNT